MTARDLAECQRIIRLLQRDVAALQAAPAITTSTSSVGPKGDTGATGPQGQAGSAGATGPAGPQGAQGIQGVTGATGPQGPAGATGSQGPQGIIGLSGAQGQPGAAGPQGPQGIQGLAGTRGDQGPPAAYTEIIQNLGVSRRSGSFDITGLSNLTVGKFIDVQQTCGSIPSKGNCTDEPEMDTITAHGVVLNSATVRVRWNATGVVVGQYAFAYGA